MEYKEVKNLIEALIFCSPEPLKVNYIEKIIKKYGVFSVNKIIKEISADFANRGINLVNVEDKWFFRTSPLLNNYLKIETEKKRKLSQHLRG